MVLVFLSTVTTPGKVNAKDWTAGCIALQNKDMDTLFKYIASGTTIEIKK
ncbi:MAG: murein L,D-transpeptidase [Flavobacterium sp.]|nr:MAG: murein L,D-transpeptidase [Flavobacterium sp.]